MPGFNKAISFALTTIYVLAFASTIHAAVRFWDNGGVGSDFTTADNWLPNTVPGASDLAVYNNGGSGTLEITSNVEVDSLRFSDGASGLHSGGTLTIGTAGPDKGLWLGEFGPLPTVYDFTGGTIQIDDDDAEGELAFMIGRGLGSSGTLNMSGAGTTVNAQDRVVHVGLDGSATVNQSEGTFNAGALQVGRFQSPNATYALSGNATLNVAGNLLMSDGATPFAAAIGSDLNITGSTPSINVGGIFLRDKANLNYVADANGVSPINHNPATVDVAGGYELKDLGGGAGLPGLTVDLSGLNDTGQNITLIKGFSFVDGSFAGLPEGTVVPGTNGRSISYLGGPDGFDVELQVTHSPYSDPTPSDGPVVRWSMDAIAPDSFFGADVKVRDSRLSAGEGSIRLNAASAREQEDLWLLSDTGNYITSPSVAPASMFANGNTGGSSSYDAGLSITGDSGALFMPSNEYGNELSFDESFTIELFFNTTGTQEQQLLLQGENFARYGLSLNEDVGGVRFFVNDGTIVETVDIGGSTGEGNANYADGLWHYLKASYEAGAGTDDAGLLTLAIANEDGTTTLVTRDIPDGFLGLPSNPDDGNTFIGVEGFDLSVDPEFRRFAGLIDEVQITRGLVDANDMLGVLNLGSAIPGDYDGNGSVGQGDLDIVLLNWGTGTFPGDELALPGGGPFDGAVNQNELDGVLLNWGNTSLLSVSTAVPEPSTALVLTIGIALLGLNEKRVRLHR